MHRSRHEQASLLTGLLRPLNMPSLLYLRVFAFALSSLWNVLPQGFAKLASSCHSDLSLNSSSSERLSLHPQTHSHIA